MSTQETVLYIARHGKTMFNTIQRTQGWSDTPLTKEGIAGVTYLAHGLKNISFKHAYSSDSGRAIETAQLILKYHPHRDHIPYATDRRIREWCFGSLEGGYDGELWGVVPRILAFDNFEAMMNGNITYEKIAEAIIEADTANWAEPYSEIKNRIWNGFKDIAVATENDGGGNVLIVSHGMTISNLLYLIDETMPVQQHLVNASITKIRYNQGAFEILGINDISYMDQGKNSIK